MFQFPFNPAVGDLFNPVAGVTFRWNGTAWYLIAGPGAFLTVADGDARYVQPSQLPPIFGRNAIIGGDFSTNPWQRGTSFPVIANQAYSADRFIYVKSGTMVHTVSKSADGPTVAQCGQLVTDCVLIDCTTAQAVIGAAESCSFVQRIEGYNFMPLAQHAAVMTFWHKHTKTGIYCVALRNSGADRSFVAEYVQDVSDTWEKATIAIPASPSAGTWNYTNGVGLHVQFALAAGTTLHTPAGSWQAGSFFSSANQVNACDNVANNFRIALVQLEAGTVATPFEWRHFQVELELCQRYFWKTFQMSVAPAQAAGMTGAIQSAPTSAGVTGPNAWVKFPVRMRATPTITSFNPTQANSNWRNFPNTADCTLTTNAVLGEAAVGLQGSVAADTTLYAVHLTANSEL